MAALVITPDPADLQIIPGEDALIALRITNVDGTDHDLTVYDGILLDLRVNGVRRMSYSQKGLSVNPQLRPLAVGSAARVPVTASAATDRLTYVSHGLTVGTRVRLVAGTPPAPLALDTNYFITAIPSADTFQLAATPGGPAIDLTTDGASLFITTPDLPRNRLYFQAHSADTLESPPGDITAFLTLERLSAEGFSQGGQTLRVERFIGRMRAAARPFTAVPTA